MSYHPGYDNYDNYSRPVSRAMSRRQSMSYPSTPYQPSMYGDEAPAPFPGQQPYYGHAASAVVPVTRHLTGGGYDEYDEPYYDQHSMGGMNPGMGHAMSMNSMSMTRPRRQSTVSFTGVPPTMGMDSYRLPGSPSIKFKRKGAFMGGVGLDEAQSRHTKLSNNDHYTFHDLHADGRRRIHCRIKWTGYSSLTYEIPLDGYDGRVDLQTLARRISRACVHYLQANVIPVVWNRVVLHHLEEVQYGVWQPMLSMR